MINPYDLMLGNWIINGAGVYIDVESLVPDPRECPHYKWLVNDEPSEFYKPIPLTLELMKTIGWRVHEWDARNYAGMDPIPTQGAEGAYIEGNEEHPLVVINFIISDGWGQWKKGDIMIFNELITTLHELQQLYRRKMGKHLEVSL